MKIDADLGYEGPGEGKLGKREYGDRGPAHADQADPEPGDGEKTAREPADGDD